MPDISAFDPDRSGNAPEEAALLTAQEKPDRNAGGMRTRRAWSARVTSMFAAAVLAAVVTGIVVNALALQKGRHPAPFFGRSFALPESAPVDVVPVPVARPAATALQNAASTVRPQPAAAPVETARPTPAAADPIGQLIKGAAAPKQGAQAHAGRGHAGAAPQ